MSKSKNKLFSLPELRVVNASAGAGKTYALAKRYIQLLLTPAQPILKNILAITFTNKAAVEMKERIIDFLKKLALGVFSSAAEQKDILSSLGMTNETAKRKAFFAMDSIVGSYSFFQVQTIDSFIKSVISNCALRLNLSPYFKIKQESDEYLSFSLDLLIEKANKDKKLLDIFKTFIKQYLYVEDNPGWFPKQNMLKRFKELHNKSSSYGGSFRTSSRFSPDSLFVLRRKIISHLTVLLEELPDGTNKIFEKSLNSILEHGAEEFSVDDISSYFSRKKFPINKGYEVTGRINELWDTIRAEIDNLCRCEAYTLFNCYIEIFDILSRDLSNLKNKDDVLFLCELNSQASRLFGKNEITVPELYYRLAARFRHFLIDEFQDTSVLQWKNFKPLVEEALSSGGSLFYVGDKKQAIYRFRGGDSDLFDEIPKEFKAYNPQEEFLKDNFRSHKEIVEFNNYVFSSGNLRRFIEGLKEKNQFDEEDVSDILRVFSGSEQTFAQGNMRGYVSIRHVNEDDENEIRKQTVDLVMNLKERFSFSDIAILARDNKDVELLTGWLLREKIPVESEKTLNLRENAYIKELMSFLLYLESPIDNLSFASFIQGEIFLKASGITGGEIQEFIFSVNLENKGSDTHYLYRKFRDSYAKIWDEFIEEFFTSSGFVPLYELMVSIFVKFRVMENFPGHLAFFMSFLELIKKFETENTGISRFIDYFNAAKSDELYVTAAHEDAVKLLTVHKSKGLEFPVVIIPFLEMKLNPSKGKDGSGLFDVLSSEQGLELVRLSKKYAEFSEELALLYKNRQKKVLIDELNAMYVALTRPICELYAFIPSHASNSINPAQMLIQEQNIEKGKQIKYEIKKKTKAGELSVLQAGKLKNWVETLGAEFSDEALPADRRKALKGNFIHQALSYIGSLNDGNKEEEIKNAAQRAILLYPFMENLDEIGNTLKNIVDTDGIKRFFYVENGKVLQEKEMMDSNGNLKRADRIIIKDNEVWVIDYKSSRDKSDSHINQLREYKDILKQIYPKNTVKGYLLYLDTASVEEV